MKNDIYTLFYLSVSEVFACILIDPEIFQYIQRLCLVETTLTPMKYCVNGGPKKQLCCIKIGCSLSWRPSLLVSRVPRNNEPWTTRHL